MGIVRAVWVTVTARVKYPRKEPSIMEIAGYNSVPSFNIIIFYIVGSQGISINDV